MKHTLTFELQDLIDIKVRKQDCQARWKIVKTSFGVNLLKMIFAGAHMNPAVTLAFAVIRRLPWRKVPVYWLAQMLGAFIASACCYGVYYGKLLSK